MGSDFITRSEQAAVNRLTGLYAEMSIDAQGEFHRAIDVYAANPLAMFLAGAAFVIVIWIL
jgi:hypothetical protein